MRVLITGFMPFGGESINPSFEAIKNIPFQELPCECLTLELPVVYYESSKKLIDAIHSFEPDVIIMVGQAGGRKEISLERIAINLDDSTIPDQKGVTPMDDPISLFGPVAYFSTLPVRQILHRLQNLHIPTNFSYSAGTYICNHVFYSCMHELNVTRKTHVKAGFIHVPYTTSQTVLKSHLFSLDLNIITDALKAIILESIAF